MGQGTDDKEQDHGEDQYDSDDEVPPSIGVLLGHIRRRR